jgi:hypothetical protein
MSRRASHIWAERYDRSLLDVFAMQDEITNAIVPRSNRNFTRRRAFAPGASPPTAWMPGIS